MGDADPGAREGLNVRGREMNAVRAPDVGRSPAELGEVLDRRAAVELPAVGLLLHGLREMGVELQAEPPRQRRRVGHQLLRDGERRAWRDGDLHHRPGAGLVQPAGQLLCRREHRVRVFDHRVRRQPTLRLAEIHRPARGDNAHADLAGRAHFRLHEPASAAREEVVVVEDGRAAGQRELGQPGASRCVLGLVVEPRPHGIELAQPGEEIGVLRPRPSERLEEVVMRVDEARRDHRAGEIDDLVRLRRRTVTDRGDHRTVDEHPPRLVLRARVVHRHDPPVREQPAHLPLTLLRSYSRASDSWMTGG